MSVAEPGQRQLAGLWEVPLFLFSLPIALATIALGWRLGVLHPAPQASGHLPVQAVLPVEPRAVLPDENLLVQASKLSAEGHGAEALGLIGRYRAKAADAAQRRKAALLEAEVLEGMGEFEKAIQGYQALAEDLPKEEVEPQAQMGVRLARSRFRLSRAQTFRDPSVLEAALASLKSASARLAAAPWPDEAAFWEGELQLALTRPADAERAYRRVAGTDGLLKAAALLRIGGIYQDRQGLSEAHAAVLQAARLAEGKIPGPPWIPAAEPERQMELLSQLWRQADKPERALDLERILQASASDRVEHYLHAAQIHEQWAERLAAQPERARAEFREAGLSYRGPVDAGIPAPYAQMLFRSAQAFERAGDVPETVRSLERFCLSYGDDARFPQAVYLLTQHYRSLGLYEKALALLERSRPMMRQERGTVHYVPLTMYEEGLCEYLSRAPGSRLRASATFRDILEHPDIYPDSQAWRDSLFALASMEYEDAEGGAQPMRQKARAHLAEWIERYGEDPRQARAHLMLGFLAWTSGDFAAASTAFRAVADRARVSSPEGSLLVMGRSAALLAAEAVYRDACARADKAALAEARDRFAEARDLNLGSWGAPWALARMADCSRALGQAAEASRLYAVARWEYGQLGAAAGPAPEGTAGIESLVAWRADVSQWLGRP